MASNAAANVIMFFLIIGRVTRGEVPFHVLPAVGPCIRGSLCAEYRTRITFNVPQPVARQSTLATCQRSKPERVRPQVVMLMPHCKSLRACVCQGMSARHPCEGSRTGSLLIPLFLRVLNFLPRTKCTEPSSHVRTLKAKCCAPIPWFSVPVCARLSRYAIGYSSQVVEFLAMCSHHNAVVHVDPP